MNAAFLVAVTDVLAGVLLGTAGIGEWRRHPRGRLGLLLIAASVGWFLGDAWIALALLHRGPLTHSLLADREGRVTRLGGSIAAVAWICCILPISSITRVAWAGVGVALVALLLGRAMGTLRRDRSAQLPVLLSGAVYGAVLTASSVITTSGLAYGASVALVGASMCWRLRREPRGDPVAGVVIELGQALSGTAVRQRLAHAIGDPTLMVGYRVGDAVVDEDGRPLTLDVADDQRAVTEIRDGDRVVAVLVHDRATLSDPRLLAAVSGALRVALANAELRAQALDDLEQLDSSRRRLLAAADAERVRLRTLLETGPVSLLNRVADAVSEDDMLSNHVNGVRAELRSFGADLSPVSLGEHGLSAALDALADVVPLPVVRRLDVVEVPEDVGLALYFVAAEALTNVVKFAQATEVTMTLGEVEDALELSVIDDGVGGADSTRGSGLRGLADRMDAVGGTLRVISSSSGSTVTARVALG